MYPGSLPASSPQSTFIINQRGSLDMIDPPYIPPKKCWTFGNKILVIILILLVGLIIMTTTFFVVNYVQNENTTNAFESRVSILEKMETDTSIKTSHDLSKMQEILTRETQLATLIIQNMTISQKTLKNDLSKIPENLTRETQNIRNSVQTTVNELATLIIQKMNILEHFGTSFQNLENQLKAIHRLQNCAEIQHRNQSSKLIHLIYPTNDKKGVWVKCDFTTKGGSWTIIQTRTSGPRDQFFKNWTDYEIGFGDVEGNYWLGLLNIHSLTHGKCQMLRVEMSDWNDTTAYAEYSSFAVGGPLTNYTLSIGGYSGTAGDSLIRHNKMKFSTPDQDNDDTAAQHCAVRDNGGWWFKNCTDSNLNGLYTGPHQSISHNDTMTWLKWKNLYYSLKTVTMKIREA